jgi:three-Cys-motif partner protein
MPAERPWGFWTESKLDMLSAYLPAFTTASTRAPRTVYLDLFAGQANNVSRDTGRPIDGSLLRALQTQPVFDVVRGFELRRSRALSLEAAFRTEFPGRDVVIHSGDVHEALAPALSELAAYRTAPTLAFVDPDGVEARWQLLEILAGHKLSGQYKVELFLLMPSPQVVRIAHEKLDPEALRHAEEQITDLFGTSIWRPILAARRSGLLDPEQTRDELTNLMRWRLEKNLEYRYTHAARLTNTNGTPIYDMIFATDHGVGDKIMKSVYAKAADRFPRMRQEARARRRDRQEFEAGLSGLFSYEQLATDAPLRAQDAYRHVPPVRPYGYSTEEPG